MDEGAIAGVLSVFLLVGLNGFFVAGEFALVTVRRTRIEELVGDGSSSAKVVQSALRDLDRYIAGTQVGITLASLALGWIGEPALVTLISPILGKLSPSFSLAASHSVAIGIAFALITFMHVILGELVPKSLALQLPESTSLTLARPLAAAVLLFQPLIWSLNGLGNLILKMIGLRTAAGHELVHSSGELESLVQESHKAGVLDDMEKGILQRAFRFSETSVSEVMVPRAQMQALDINMDLEAFITAASESKHSRLPVYEKSIDQVVGIIYLYELFRMSRRGGQKLRDHVKPALFVPNTLRLDGMIRKFREQNMQIAIIIDEHGGTAGLITLEDVVEAVFGKIQDVNEEPLLDRVGDKATLIRGDARIVELNESLGLGIETPDVDTIAGYIMHTLGRVPKIGDQVAVNGKKLIVRAMNRVRVTKIEITKS